MKDWYFKIILYVLHLLVLTLFATYVKAKEPDSNRPIEFQATVITNPAQLDEAINRINLTEQNGVIQETAKDLAVNNIISATDPEALKDLNVRWRALKNLSAVYHVDIPIRMARNHFNEQTSYYRSDKAAIIMLTVLTTNSALNWFILADGPTLETKALVVAVNAFLYAYLGVNVNNWNHLLEKSELLVEKVRSMRVLNKMSDKTASTIATTSVNFSYYMLYGYAIQGILNWTDISVMAGGDIFRLVLQNSMLGVFSSGIWDPVFRSWLKSGAISANTYKKILWGRGILMVTLSNMVAIGLQQGYVGMGIVGTTGLVTLVAGSKVAQGTRFISSKLQTAKDKLAIRTTSWTFKDSSLNFNLPKAKTAAAATMTAVPMCRQVFLKPGLAY